MAWLSRFIVGPLRRAWSSTPLIHRPRSRRQNTIDEGFSKLYYHVQSCGYEDVQVMWGMLNPSHEASATCRRKMEVPSFPKCSVI
ncbi:hypothetical protein KP509_20G034700 [Ceratopteris richardii]|uniref:Uncharacterized protein n=1 Tax=Ceratopteris richardii TaxID=49495 RepID=A0A8T2SG84_CERRI|nr:hypothetical protein KP509_20G034700 [Ceratopteris richardii]